MSQAEENYLKAIYSLQADLGSGLSTNIIAQKIDTKASSVTDMLKKLAVKKLVNYKKYQGVTLTKKGSDTAIKVIRKHRLWETFLVNKLNFNWDEVHDVAEQLEHIKSEKLMQQLDAFLAFPKLDPHGDPIPDSDGNFPILNQMALNQLNIHDTCVLMGVKDSSVSFLKYLDQQNIQLGDSIQIMAIEPYDKTFQIEINSRVLLISKDITNNLIVKTA